MYLTWRRRHDPKGWSLWRTSSFLLGIALLIAALVPQFSPFPEGDFRYGTAKDLSCSPA
ncbi:hypothetical protein [Agromyces bauzanensis]|uniref:hypothetical protein n=1 Tax=Agromyces bauzanensis TaxID=1308924 RepID=UPI001666FA78